MTRSTRNSPRWPTPLRPLAGAEDLARKLVRSLDPDQAARAVLLDRAPSDIVGGNRPKLSDGDQVIHLRDIWRGQFADPGLLDLVTRTGDGAEQASGYDAADHLRVALTSAPKGLAAAELGARQRDLLRALLATYLDRVPDGLAPAPDDAALDAVYLAWAGPTGLGEPDYYRLQGPGCSSSTTTRHGRRITRTRCGATRGPTSATTCSAPTWPRTTCDWRDHRRHPGCACTWRTRTGRPRGGR